MSRRPHSTASFATLVRCCAVLATVIAASGCSKKEAPPPAPAEVSVQKVEPRDTPVTFEYIAQTQSPQQVNIVARVNGFLDKQLYTEGSIVKEGQVLFQMDQRPFVAQLEAMQAAMDRTKAANDTAASNLKRVRPLAEQNALSQKDLDDATGSDQSTAAAVAQARANVETAKLNLSYTTIASPLRGVAAAAQQKEGAYLSPQSNMLTTVSSLHPMWVNFSLSENELKNYRNEVSQSLLKPPPGQGYTVELILVDGSTFAQTGKITFIDPSFNPQTGTFLIRVTVPNPDATLRPNQYVRVRLKGAVRPNAIAVPQRAVQQGAKGHFVWVVDKDGKAELRPVTVGEWYGDQWFINDGLKPGEQVVVDGGLRLRPGAPVKATPVAAAPAPAEPVVVEKTPAAKPAAAGAPIADPPKVIAPGDAYPAKK
ncbi:MAG: efflux RND transporter periplasmic adaptor subunit [Burkholderiales bacterium]